MPSFESLVSLVVMAVIMIVMLTVSQQAIHSVIEIMPPNSAWNTSIQPQPAVVLTIAPTTVPTVAPAEVYTTSAVPKVSPTISPPVEATNTATPVNWVGNIWTMVPIAAAGAVFFTYLTRSTGGGASSRRQTDTGVDGSLHQAITRPVSHPVEFTLGDVTPAPTHTTEQKPQEKPNDQKPGKSRWESLE